jgi:hypothetical protein
MNQANTSSTESNVTSTFNFFSYVPANNDLNEDNDLKQFQMEMKLYLEE